MNNLEEIHREQDNEALAVFVVLQEENIDLVKIEVNRSMVRASLLRHPLTHRSILSTSIILGLKIEFVIELVKTFELDIDSYDKKNDDTPLLLAIRLGNTGLVKVFIEVMGASLGISNSKNQNALMLAAVYGYFSICNLFLNLENSRFLVNQSDIYGNNCLLLAIKNKNLNIAELILDKCQSLGLCLDVNATDNFGVSSIIAATKINNRSIVYKLLQEGANINQSATIYGSACKLAEKKGYRDIVNMFDCASTIQEESRVSRENEMQKDSNIESYNQHYNQYNSFSQDIETKDVKVGKNKVDVTHKNYSLYVKKKVLNNRDSLNSATTTVTHCSRKSSLIRKEKINLIPEIKKSAKQKGDNLVNEPTINFWKWACKIATICMIPYILEKVLKSKDKHLQQAWREKFTLCLIIALISLFTGFLSFGFSGMICKQTPVIYESSMQEHYSSLSKKSKLKYMSLRGKIYDVGTYFKVGNHRPILPFNDDDLEPLISDYYGKDLSLFFPPLRDNSLCKFWAPDYSVDPNVCNKKLNDSRIHCHVSKASLEALHELDTNNKLFFSWNDISNSLEKDDKVVVFKSNVYRVSSYLDNANQYFGEKMTHVLRNNLSRDITKIVLRDKELEKFIPCMDEQFYVGKLDGQDINCLCGNVLMIVTVSIVALITSVKLIGAIFFQLSISKTLGKLNEKYRHNYTLSNVILFVTCYSENENSIKHTLDSLAASSYDDDHKILFVVADGDVTGSGNTKSTPNILKNLMIPLDSEKGHTKEPLPYIALGDYKQQHNRAEVHVGHYAYKNKKISYLLVVKVGTEYEKENNQKSGNRGKRDSQLILMKWLKSICFNELMTPLELEMTYKFQLVTKKNPTCYNFVLMVDADTVVMENSISHMVSAMENDNNIMGLCGEARISNKSDSWITKIQVYEYFISHNLGKAFESMFGGVTCLPGCFSMYRIKVLKNGNFEVPILASPDIISLYASNDVSTLHRKNLLLLGEDRFLSTILLKTFPKRKMVYVPKAVCKTVVPDEFKVLVSQRRRWINSTIHNLMELVLVNQLCGIFCCSMQFIIFVELLSTCILPASTIFSFYILVKLCAGYDVLIPLLMMIFVFIVQALLIIVFSRKFSYITWFIVYLLAIPIWNFVLPVYSFWHFDDFSWGETRKTRLVNHKSSQRDNFQSYNEEKMVFRRYEEWVRDIPLNNNQSKNMHSTRQSSESYSGTLNNCQSSITKSTKANYIHSNIDFEGQSFYSSDMSRCFSQSSKFSDIDEA